MRPGKFFGIAFGAAVFLATLLAIGPIFMPDAQWPGAARDLLAAEGRAKTGAGNMVSAIYLGYRAFDTLGETLVLLTALTGASFFIHAEHSRRGVSEKTLALREGGTRRRAAINARTDIINVVAGKLAPLVLLFGCYIMLYGHSSPGGGFQGGVLLASGVVFIAIGRKSGGLGRIDPRMSIFSDAALTRTKALAFCAILVFMFPGTVSLIERLCLGAARYGIEMSFAVAIVTLNIIIGLKVASGVALLCVFMLGGGEA